MDFSEELLSATPVSCICIQESKACSARWASIIIINDRYPPTFSCTPSSQYISTHKSNCCEHFLRFFFFQTVSVSVSIDALVRRVSKCQVPRNLLAVAASHVDPFRGSNAKACHYHLPYLVPSHPNTKMSLCTCTSLNSNNNNDWDHIPPAIKRKVPNIT